MPFFRLGSTGNWAKLTKIFRLNASGNWSRVSKIYRLNSLGNWIQIFSTALTPSVSTSPTLRDSTNIDPTTSNLATLFDGGDVITLTKGAYTNTDADTKHTLTIRRSINFGNALGVWETVAGPLDLIGSATGSLTYTVTDADANGGYYFAGRVRVDTDPTNPSSPDYFFDVKNVNALAKISFTVSGLAVSNITNNGATFNWNITGVSTNDYLYSQTLRIKTGGVNGTDAITPISLPVASRTHTISTGLNPQTSYHAVIEVIANDGWKTSNLPTLKTDDEPFNTLAPVPTPILGAPPTLSPVNNRGYLPVARADQPYAYLQGTVLSTTNGSWNESPTSYTYQWQYYNINANPVNQPLPSATSSTYTAPLNYITNYGSFIRSSVVASNIYGPSLTPHTSNYYLVDPEVRINEPTSTAYINGTAGEDIAENFGFTINGYPTSYSVNWGDGSDNFSATVPSNTETIVIPGGVVNTTSANTTTSPGNIIYTTSSSHGYTPGTVVSITSYSAGNSLFNLYSATIQSVTSTTFTVVNTSGATGNITETAQVLGSGRKIYRDPGTYTLTITAQPGSKQIQKSITVARQPVAFQTWITNVSSVGTPEAPSHSRSTTASDNRVVVELTPSSPSSSLPSDTLQYEMYVYGSGSATGGTLGNPAVQYISTLNQYNDSGVIGSGTKDAITNIALAANNSPISIYTVAQGSTRTIYANVNTNLYASSWQINYSWSNVTANQGNVTYWTSESQSFTSNSASSTAIMNTNTMSAYTGPVSGATRYRIKIMEIRGSSNPTVQINSIVAYGGTNQTGLSTNGTVVTIPITSTENSTGSLSNVPRPISGASGTTTVNYTYQSAATKLSTPINVSASDNRSDGIQVSWINVANAATYGVWWGGQPGYDSTPDFGGPNNNGGKTITSTPFLDDVVSAGTTRTYYVQAFPSTGSTTFLKSDWSAGDSGTRLSAPTQYTVTWNANGGTGGGTTGPFNAGTAHTAPSVTKGTDTFNGWYTASSGGTYVTGAGGSYTPTSNITLYAQWTAAPACTCNYSTEYTSFWYSPQCCSTGAGISGLPIVYNTGNSVCTNCYPTTTSGSCCPNVTKLYTRCSATDVTSPSSPVYFYCYSTGQCINSSQGAGGTC